MTPITEEIAKVSGWPCEMCLNGERIFGGIKSGWRDGFCQKCRKENVQSKPSEFHLRKSIDMETHYLIRDSA